MRDTQAELAELNVAVMGISPDPVDKQKKFADKYDLDFPLLSDPEHQIAEAYGAWGEKKMYGKTFLGIIRSALLIDADGRISHTWYKISPMKTLPELMKVLG